MKAEENILTIVIQTSAAYPASPLPSLSTLFSSLKPKLQSKKRKELGKLQGKFTSYCSNCLRFSGVAADSHTGKFVYFNENAVHVIKRMDVHTKECVLVAGVPNQTGSADLATLKQNKSTPIPALQAKFINPIGLAVDSVGNLIIADYQTHMVRKLDVIKETVSVVVGGDKGSAEEVVKVETAVISSPIEVAIDSRDNIYFTDRDNYAVRKIEKSTGLMRLITNKQSADHKVGKLLETHFRWPYGIFMGETDDDVYVVDRSGQCVVHLNLATNTSSRVAGTTHEGDDNLLEIEASKATFRYPWGGCYASGCLYIADQNNMSVRRVELATNKVTTLKSAETGQVFGIDVDYHNQCLWVAAERGLFKLT